MGAVLVQASLVVAEVVSRVEVSTLVAVIELYSDGVMLVLVNRPDEADQVEADIFAVASPRCCPVGMPRGLKVATRIEAILRVVDR